jgi:hypothetical protein
VIEPANMVARIASGDIEDAHRKIKLAPRDIE